MDKYYKEQYQLGLKFQEVVNDELTKRGLPLDFYETKEGQLIGETKQGIECKADFRMEQTGNCYIEISEKSNAQNMCYIPSGIYREDNTNFWCIGNFKEFYVIRKDVLIMLHETGKYREVQTGTSTGFLVPISVMEKYKKGKIKCE